MNPLDRRVILHIGGSKTGSSYLQHCFATERLRLQEAGIHYPWHENMAKAAAGQPTAGNAVKLANWLVGLASSPKPPPVLKRHLKETGSQVLLYSSERMQKYRVDRMQRLREAIEVSGRSLFIIYFVRSLAGRAWSSYSQQVRQHLEKRSFTEFLKTYTCPSPAVLKSFKACGVEDALAVVNYDTVRHRLFDAFAEATGLPQLRPLPPPSLTINRSLTPAEIELVRRLNVILDDREKVRPFADALSQQNQPGESHIAIEPAALQLLRNRNPKWAERVNRFLPEGQATDTLAPPFTQGHRRRPNIADPIERLPSDLQMHIHQLPINEIPFTAGY